MYSCMTSLSFLPAGNCGTSWPPASPDETTSGTDLKLGTKKIEKIHYAAYIRRAQSELD